LSYFRSIGRARRSEFSGISSDGVGFDLSSITGLNEFTYAVRKHWSIENQLH
jgi:predicted transposase YbfD/YdcC